MNCEEYREAITADPSESFAGGSAHSAACAECSRYRDEVHSLDARIAAALAIDVPPLRMPELAPLDRRAGNVVDFKGKRSGRIRAPVWLGIAAGVAVAVFAGLTLLSPGPARATLAEEIVAHMDHEQASRQVTSVAVSDERLYDVINPKVAAPGATAMNRNLGLVTYAQSCVINGNTVPHLVVQGESGPVTLILLPDETIEGPIPLSGDHVRGVIVPVGSGSVAIIGERSGQLEEIDRLGRRIIESVEWQI